MTLLILLMSTPPFCPTDLIAALTSVPAASSRRSVSHQSLYSAGWLGAAAPMLFVLTCLTPMTYTEGKCWWGLKLQISGLKPERLWSQQSLNRDVACVHQPTQCSISSSHVCCLTAPKHSPSPHTHMLLFRVVLQSGRVPLCCP